MKLIKHFDNFLNDTVNLNQTRIDRLNGHVDAIEKFIKNSDYEAVIKYFSAQGSWAHKTIIKPGENKEFDADLVMFIKPVDGWEPKDYVENLYRIFRDSGTYRDKVSRGTRCITLDYAGDFHLDIVPCVVRESFLFENSFEVCNRKSNIFEETDPEGYTAWLSNRNDRTGKNMLRKVTRLLKYLRDIKTSFSVKSILLTTRIGREITALDPSFQDINFPDVPTALKTIVGRVDNFLQDNPVMPVIRNPVLDSEYFNRHWDQEKYENFRSKIHQYREWIDDAYAEQDRNESVRKWRRVFGEAFAKGEVIEKATAVKSLVLSGSPAANDVVSAVRVFGTAVLNKIPINLPHVQAPIWKAGNDNVSVRVKASVYDTRNGTKIKSYASGEIINPDCWLRFEAVQKTGLPFPEKDCKVSWRVVNTDQEAVNANQLRGDFYKSDAHAIKWEETRFRGAHWVEAFLISKRNNRCMGKSERFFVVVER